MNSILIAGTALACAFGGVLFGMFLRWVIPESHLDTESKEGIKLGTGIVATMAALVLGLLV
jgi:fluoride ion exporter CrcB/FEX